MSIRKRRLLKAKIKRLSRLRAFAFTGRSDEQRVARSQMDALARLRADYAVGTVYVPLGGSAFEQDHRDSDMRDPPGWSHPVANVAAQFWF